MTTGKELVDAVVKGIQEKKGGRIVVADFTKMEGAIAQYFVHRLKHWQNR